MLYLLHGTDFKKSREKLHLLIEALLKKESSASQFRIDDENFSEDLLEEMISSQTLFGSRYIVVCDKLFADKEVGEIVLKELKNISKSQNIFIFIEEGLTKTILSRFDKWAEKIQEFKLKEIKKEEKFNIFSITDAFGSRDRKQTWVLYRRALNAGVSSEEIHGILFWQIKNLLMVKDEKDTATLELNPFVLRKSLGFVEKFRRNELIKLSKELVEIPNDSRRGLIDFDISLEKFILSF